jgi:undecaprenyl pyrophosphate phosphatase UppP
MMMSVPAVFGAALVELPHMSEGINELPSALMGALVACVAGVAAMLVLRRMVVGGFFPLFALWVFPLAVACLAMARSWPG